MPSATSQLAKSHVTERGFLFLAIAAFLLFAEKSRAASVSISIATGEATTTLPALATQTGINLVFSKAHVSGVRTHAVSGSMEPREAMERMIQGTSLGYFVDDSSGAIVVFRNRPFSNPSRDEHPGGNPEVRTATNPNHQVQTKSKTEVAPRRKLFGAILSALAVTLAPGLDGQTPAESSGDGGDSETLVLSPFVVSTADDQGYYTNSTLAGSRLNSKLNMTPGAISVFNEDFLNDINANSLYDAIGYSMAFSLETMSENANHEQFSNGNINARGFPGQSSNSKDFFSSDISTDRYNIERMTFSRGPNSILFGIGNPGGIIDTATKRAGYKNRGSFEMQVDEYGSFRATADINRSLIKDKWALRLNLLSDDRKDNRDFNLTGTERVHLASTFNPSKATTIRADFEKGNVDRLVLRRWIARDGISTWVAAGSKAVDFNNFRNNAGVIDFNAARAFAQANGGSFTNTDRPLLVYENGMLVPKNGRSEVASTGTNDMQLELLDIWDKSRGLEGPVNTSNHDLMAYSAFIEQRFTKDFYIEAAYRYEEEDRWINNIINHTALTPRLDIAPLLPNGATNPNYDRYFLESNAQITDQHRELETLRLTASYEWDSESRWMGRHRFAGLLQRVDRYQINKRYAFANRTPLGTNRNVAGNQIATRTYLSSPDRPSGERGFRSDPTTQPFMPFDLLNPVTGAVIGKVTPDWVLDRDRPQEAINESWMLAGQSFWWRDRLVLTYGYRDDTLNQRNFVETVASNADAVANPGMLAGQVLSSRLNDDPEVFAGETTSLGLAIEPLPWLTLTANASENFSPQNRFNIFNENIGNVTAEGIDYSVRLMPGGGNRFYFVLNYFETDVVNAGENLFNFFTPINQIWDTLEANNLVTGDQGIIENSVYSRDLTAEGYEVEFVYNPTRNITLRANFTVRDNEVGEVGGEIVRYLDENLGTWTPHRNVVLVNNTSQTIGSQIDLVQQRLTNVRNEIGRASSDNVRQRASFFGRYQFNQGRLKGLDFGLGARYMGDRIIQYLSQTDGSLRPLNSDAYTEIDLKIGYKRKIAGGKIDWNLQLNVRNLFNEDAALITQVNPVTLSARVYTLINPRVVSLSTGFRF